MFANKKKSDTIKTAKIWNVMRTLGLAPTPLEFDDFIKAVDREDKGTVKWTSFLGGHLSLINYNQRFVPSLFYL
jgi:Ca2+-binding EF-hand superfamily protein